MTIETPTRPRLKHVMTATAYGLVQIRLAWRAYFDGLKAQRRVLADRDRKGWGA